MSVICYFTYIIGLHVNLLHTQARCYKSIHSHSTVNIIQHSSINYIARHFVMKTASNKRLRTLRAFILTES